MRTRRTKINLIYQGTDITADISDDLLDFSWTDNESGAADDLAIKLKDPKGKWIGPWFPQKGDTIRATILDEISETQTTALFCGEFTVDQLTASGPPREFTIKGVNIPLDRKLRREKKSRAWEDTKLSHVVAVIAEGGKMTSFYDEDEDPHYDRIDQRDESDLAFLNRVCQAEGFSLKVTSNQVVVFQQAEYESRESIGSIMLGTDQVLSWSFDSQAFDLYESCTVAYYDPKTEELVQRTVTAAGVHTGMTAKITKRAHSLAEAERLARAELRRRNKHEITGKLTVKGRTAYVAGVNVDLSGFGNYSGKYMIEKATHSVQAGYTCTIDVRRVLEGY